MFTDSFEHYVGPWKFRHEKILFVLSCQSCKYSIEICLFIWNINVFFRAETFVGQHKYPNVHAIFSQFFQHFKICFLHLFYQIIWTRVSNSRLVYWSIRVSSVTYRITYTFHNSGKNLGDFDTCVLPDLRGFHVKDFSICMLMLLLYMWIQHSSGG
jgi:hypothetical protein